MTLTRLSAGLAVRRAVLTSFSDRAPKRRFVSHIGGIDSTVRRGNFVAETRKQYASATPYIYVLIRVDSSDVQHDVSRRTFYLGTSNSTKLRPHFVEATGKLFPRAFSLGIRSVTPT